MTKMIEYAKPTIPTTKMIARFRRARLTSPRTRSASEGSEATTGTLAQSERCSLKNLAAEAADAFVGCVAAVAGLGAFLVGVRAGRRAFRRLTADAVRAEAVAAID